MSCETELKDWKVSINKNEKFFWKEVEFSLENKAKKTFISPVSQPLFSDEISDC